MTEPVLNRLAKELGVDSNKARNTPGSLGEPSFDQNDEVAGNSAGVTLKIYPIEK